MDDGKGNFVPMDVPFSAATERADMIGRGKRFSAAVRSAKYIFQVGEELEIKGSRFRVKSIGKHELHLTLLPALKPE